MTVPFKYSKREVQSHKRNLEIERFINWQDEIDSRLDMEAFEEEGIESIAILTEAMMAANCMEDF